MATRPTIEPPPGHEQIGQIFGADFSVSGNQILIGAPGKYHPTQPTSNMQNLYGGQAYLYDIPTGNLVREFTTDDPLDDKDEFGETVYLTGSYALVQASGENATYVFDATSGDQIFKAEGVKAKMLVGDRLFGEAWSGQGESIRKAQEFDFFSSISVDGALDLNISSVLPGTLGAFSFEALDQLTISTNIQSKSGLSGTVTTTTLNSINAIFDNILRMEATLDSKTNRVESEFNRLNDEKIALLKPKEHIDNTLITQKSLNPYELSVLSSDPYKAMTVLP